MSKQDYIRLAQIVREAREATENGEFGDTIFPRTMDSLCSWLSEANANFDEKKFRAACEPRLEDEDA